MNCKKIPKKALIILVDVLVYTFLIASLVFALFSLLTKTPGDGFLIIMLQVLKIMYLKLYEIYSFDQIWW